MGAFFLGVGDTPWNSGSFKTVFLETSHPRASRRCSSLVPGEASQSNSRLAAHTPMVSVSLESLRLPLSLEARAFPPPAASPRVLIAAVGGVPCALLSQPLELRTDPSLFELPQLLQPLTDPSCETSLKGGC